VAGFGKTENLKEDIRNADLIFAFNTTLGDIVTDSYRLLEVPNPKQDLIHSHLSEKELGKVYQAEIPINAGPNMLALELSKLNKLGDWSEYRSYLRKNYLKSFDIKKQPGKLDMKEIMNILQDTLPDDVIFCNGAGNFSLWSNSLFRYGENARLIAPTSGAMGFGLPSAIAIKITCPERTVICFTGDGDFQMNMPELGVAMQKNAIPIIILINNGSYGTIRMHQEKNFPNRKSGTDIQNPDFIKVAQAYGIKAVKINKTEHFYSAFKEILEKNEGGLLELVIDIESITPHKTLSEFKKVD
jgi:acetolactate synthase-1/2/3 large subunit